MTEVPRNHPDDAALRALSLGELDEEELERVSAHLGDCLECCRRIDDLSIDDPLLKRLKEIAASGEAVLGTPDEHRSAARAFRRTHEGT